MTFTSAARSNPPPILLNDQEKWQKWIQPIFWDRQVDLTTWQAQWCTGHPSYFPHTVRWAQPKEAVRWLGRERFVQHWPTVRLCLDVHNHPEMGPKRTQWDMEWSRQATGTPDVAPLPTWFTLTPKTQALLIWIARHQGRSIYAVAQGVGRPYRRVHDHVCHLEQLGFVRLYDKIHQGRRQKIVYAVQATHWERIRLNTTINEENPWEHWQRPVVPVPPHKLGKRRTLMELRRK